MNRELESHPAFSQLHRTVLRLTLISHANAGNYDLAPSEHRPAGWRTRSTQPLVQHVGQRSRGGGDSKAPAGGVDVKGDRESDYRQKSADYFARRLALVSTAAQLEALADEARDALDAWMRTPVVAGVDPERGTFAWKCRIADDHQHVDEVARLYTIDRATVYRYRQKYRGVRAVFCPTGE